MKQRIQEALRRRHRKGEEGFTLIELLVVILIIAILAVVGILALLTALRSGRESAAKTAVRSAVTAIKAAQTGEGETTFNFLAADPDGTMNTAEPDVTWTDGGTAPEGGENSVSIAATATQVNLASAADNGDCFYVRMDATNGTEYNAAAGGTCTGDAAAGLGTGWERSSNEGWDLP